MVRQRSWWIAGLLLVALTSAALVAWRWLQSDAAPVGAVAGDRSRPDDRSSDADLPDAASDQDAPPDAAPRREVEAPAPGDPTLAADHPAGARFKNAIALTVVRHEDGVPIAGAEVTVFDVRRVQREEIAALARDPAEKRRRASFLLRTDKTGLAQVPRPVQRWWLLAVADGRRGCLGVTAASFEPQRLELWKAREIAVRVVDEQGLPHAGIAVALVEGERPFLDAPLRATTDAEGNAQLVDLDLEESLQASTRKLSVGLALPLFPPVGAAVELDPPPAEPVVLTLPATGAIAFQVVDDQGEPLAVAGEVALVAAATAEGLDERTRRRGGSVGNGTQQTTRIALDAQGRGVAPRVGLGLQFRATAQLPERTSPPQRGSGPLRAGESVEVALPADAVGPVFTGRVVGSGDAPLVGAELGATLDAFDADGKRIGSDGAATTVEADGSFRLDFCRSGLKGRECQLFLRATRDGGSVAEAKSTATLPLSGVVELGTIRLAPPPLLASGRVVDDEGDPVEEAFLRIEAKLDPPIPFKANHLPTLVTGKDGVFELRGELPDGDLSLRASRSGYLPMKPLPFVAGARDLVLTLRMAGALAGSLRLPDGFPNDLLNVRMSLPTTRWPVVETQNVRGDGSFRFPLLAAGVWKFELLLGRDVESAEAVAAIHQVAVRPAELTRDVRLQELDLASLVRIVAATVRVPGGALAEKGTVGRVAPGRNAKSRITVSLREGRALIPCTSVPADLQVAVPGFLVQTVAGVEGPVDVLMRRGLAVRFVVSGRLERRPDWIPVRVTPRPRDESLAALWPGDPALLDRGEGSLVLPAPGRYRARIDFGPPPDPNAAPGAARSVGRGMRSEIDFDVKEVDREQVVELKVKQ